MGGTDGFLYLSDAVLAGLEIGAAEVADCIEAALRERAAGGLWTGPKTVALPGDGRYLMATLAAADRPQAMVVKSVLLNPRNPGRGLDLINGAILVLDGETGVLRAVMDANWITGARTAGLSAVAARRLANPDASVIAFIGCGVQARSHLDAFSEMFPLAQVRACGRGQANIDRLCELARDKGLSARACADPREAMREADIVVSSVTRTPGLAPFLDARWLKPGAFAAVTDLAMPWLPEGLAAFATMVIDDLEQERAMAHPMLPLDLVTCDIAGLVAGTAPAAYTADRRAAFVFRGIAAGDFALSALAEQRARALGRGVRVAG